MPDGQAPPRSLIGSSWISRLIFFCCLLFHFVQFSATQLVYKGHHGNGEDASRDEVIFRPGKPLTLARCHFRAPWMPMWVLKRRFYFNVEFFAGKRAAFPSKSQLCLLIKGSFCVAAAFTPIWASSCVCARESCSAGGGRGLYCNHLAEIFGTG